MPGESSSLKMSDLSYWALPDSFRQGLDKLKQHKAFRRYPLFWQVFLWGFGGFYLKDRTETEFALLSEQTGVPVDEVPNALQVFDSFSASKRILVGDAGTKVLQALQKSCGLAAWWAVHWWVRCPYCKTAGPRAEIRYSRNGRWRFFWFCRKGCHEVWPVQTSAPLLAVQNTILFNQIAEYVSLLAAQPPDEDREQQLERRGVNHGGNILRTRISRAFSPVDPFMGHYGTINSSSLNSTRGIGRA